MVRVLIAERRDVGGNEAQLDVFNPATGAFIQNVNYEADYPAGFDVECLLGRIDGKFLGRFSTSTSVILNSNLSFSSVQELTSPLGPAAGVVPQFFPNIPIAATRVIGYWTSFTNPTFNTSVQDIDPITLAQTTLWSNFQPDTEAGVEGDCLSRDGNFWFYNNNDTKVYKLNLTTGSSVEFCDVADVGAGGFGGVGTYDIYELPDLTVLILLSMPGDPDPFLRILQYTALGVPSGIDISLEGIGGSVFVPDPEGNYVWVLGGSAVDSTVIMQKYGIPGGALLVDTTAPDDTADYVDLLIGDISGGGDVVITQLRANCSDDPVTMTIIGSGFSVSPSITLTVGGDPVTFSISSSTDTEINLSDIDPIFDSGSVYCAVVDDSDEFCSVLTCTAPVVGSGVYFIEVGKRQDTLFTGYNPDTTVDVKIPNPFIETYLVGDE